MIAVDEMDQVLDQGLRHDPGCALSGLENCWFTYPGRRCALPWAGMLQPLRGNAVKDFPRGINSFHGHGVPRDAMNVATAMLRGVSFQPAMNWVRPFMAGYTRPAMNLTSANVSHTFNQPCREYGSIWPGENLPHESCSKCFTTLPFGAKAQGPTSLSRIVITSVYRPAQFGPHNQWILSP